MMNQTGRFIGRYIFVVLVACCAGRTVAEPGSSAERFEVTSIKAVRPILVDTFTAIQQGDVARARQAFEGYDSAWNGIEVYINTRSRALYQVLELDLQVKITKGLDAPRPDMAALLADTQMMLAKYEEAIDLVTKAAPLDPLYDDVARLRIVRGHLRDVNPALKAGNLAKAQKSFEAFEDMWFNVEDFVRAQSLDAYLAIERGMLQIEEVLLVEKPDVAKAMALVNAVMNSYNAVVTEVQRQARSSRQ